MCRRGWAGVGCGCGSWGEEGQVCGAGVVVGREGRAGWGACVVVGRGGGAGVQCVCGSRERRDRLGSVVVGERGAGWGAGVVVGRGGGAGWGSVCSVEDLSRAECAPTASSWGLRDEERTKERLGLQ